MGLLIKHKEDSEYHIYTMRNRIIWLLHIMLVILTFIISSYTYNVYRRLDVAIYPFVIFLLLILIGIIDFTPMWLKKISARTRGKKVIETQKGGSIFQGYRGLDFEIKIEK